MRFFHALMLAAICCLAAPIASQEPPAASPPRPCQAEGYDQFAFWVGTWDVSERGEVAGRNEIREILDGCAIEESWTSSQSPVRGQSFSTFRPASGEWHQTYVDNFGALLLLSGRWQDGKMVLTGDSPSQRNPSQRVHYRLTWEPLTDGRVRQTMEGSRTGGQSWDLLFEGLYTRAGAAP